MKVADALKVLTKGDTLVVLRLDRLGRSLRDLANIAHEIEQAGAHLRVIEQSVDTATSASRAFFGMLAVFAQFETDVRRERQEDGIARAKKAGIYTGGKPRINRDRREGTTACEDAMQKDQGLPRPRGPRTRAARHP